MVLVYGIWLQGGKRFHLPGRYIHLQTLCGTRYTKNEEGFWEFESIEVLMRDFLCINACKYGKTDHGEICLPFGRPSETKTFGGWVPIPRFTVRRP